MLGEKCGEVKKKGDCCRKMNCDMGKGFCGEKTIIEKALGM